MEYAEWQRTYQEELDEAAVRYQSRGMPTPPTDVRFERFIALDEYGSVHADCLQEQGFQATATWDGGVEFGEMAADQTPALLTAKFRCMVRFPVHPKYNLPHTAEQLRVMYEYLVKELTPCLIRQGYPVDTTEVPTLETFRAAYDRDTGPWTPYEAVIQRQEELTLANGGIAPAEWPAEWQRINEECPQNPPLDVLYPNDE